MNILIVGVNGFLGNAIADRAVSQGHRVFGLSRSDAPSSDRGFAYFNVDRSNPSQILEVVQTQKIDVLVDVIPMTFEDSQPLIKCIDKQISQYVMISSCDVYRNYELFQRKTSGTAYLEAVDEDSELRRTKFPYRGETARALDAEDRFLDDYDKIPIEKAAMEMASSWTIVRLPMVYGPGDKQRRFRWAIKPMIDGLQKIVVPRGWANWVSTYGYIDNVAEAIALSLGNTKAHNKIYNAGDKTSVSHLEWAKRFAQILDWDGSIELTDDLENTFAKRIASLDLTVPFRVSSNRIRDELGYQEVVSRSDSLARTIASEKDQ